jgi:hypothetical protein
MIARELSNPLSATRAGIMTGAGVIMGVLKVWAVFLAV